MSEQNSNTETQSSSCCCMPYFIANIASMMVISEYNRTKQRSAVETDETFQMELETAKNITEDKLRQKDIAFKRHLVDIELKRRQEEVQKSYSNQMDINELQRFIKQYWPIDDSYPITIIDMVNKEIDVINAPLNVILLRPMFLPRDSMGRRTDGKVFEQIENMIKDADTEVIGDIDFWNGASIRGNILCSNTDIMNLYFLMSPLPTLVIYPYYCRNKMHFNYAVWNALSAQPFMRYTFSYEFSQVKAQQDKDYQKEAVDKFRTSVAVIIGTVRDAYMLCKCKPQTLSTWLHDKKHKDLKTIIHGQPEIRDYIIKEWNETLKYLDTLKTQKDNAFATEEIDYMIENIKVNLEKL